MPKFDALQSKEVYKVYKSIIRYYQKNTKPISLGSLLKIQENKTSISGLSEKIDCLCDFNLLEKKKDGKYILITLKNNLFENYESKEVEEMINNEKYENLQKLIMFMLTTEKGGKLAQKIIQAFI